MTKLSYQMLPPESLNTIYQDHITRSLKDVFGDQVEPCPRCGKTALRQYRNQAVYFCSACVTSFEKVAEDV